MSPISLAIKLVDTFKQLQAIPEHADACAEAQERIQVLQDTLDAVKGRKKISKATENKLNAFRTGIFRHHRALFETPIPAAPPAPPAPIVIESNVHLVPEDNLTSKATKKRKAPESPSNDDKPPKTTKHVALPPVSPVPPPAPTKAPNPTPPSSPSAVPFALPPVSPVPPPAPIKASNPTSSPSPSAVPFALPPVTPVPPPAPTKAPKTTIEKDQTSLPVPDFNDLLDDDDDDDNMTGIPASPLRAPEPEEDEEELVVVDEGDEPPGTYSALPKSLSAYKTAALQFLTEKTVVVPPCDEDTVIRIADHMVDFGFTSWRPDPNGLFNKIKNKAHVTNMMRHPLPLDAFLEHWLRSKLLEDDISIPLDDISLLVAAIQLLNCHVATEPFRSESVSIPPGNVVTKDSPIHSYTGGMVVYGLKVDPPLYDKIYACVVAWEEAQKAKK